MKSRKCNTNRARACHKESNCTCAKSNRRPFRPTEMISPIYGYNRPSVEKRKKKNKEVKGKEDLEISVEGKSVVDAWLEKKVIHYLISQKAKHRLLLVMELLTSKESDNMKSKKEEKSVVDRWLRKRL